MADRGAGAWAAWPAGGRSADAIRRVTSTRAAGPANGLRKRIADRTVGA